MKVIFIWFWDNLDLSFYNNGVLLYGLIITIALYFAFTEFGINPIISGVLSGALGMKLASFSS